MNLYLLRCFLFSFGMFMMVSLGFAHESESIRYTENKGQWHSNIRYKAKLRSGYLYLEESRLKYFLFHPKQLSDLHGKLMYPTDDKLNAHVYQISFPNANPKPEITTEQPFTDYENYFIGQDRSKWKSHVKGFQKIKYNNLYNNIDLEVYSERQSVKYDFVVKAGGDANQIRLNYQGQDRLYLKEGKLHIVTSVNELVEHIPLAYQTVNGEQMNVRCEYRFWNDSTLCFYFPDGYDSRYPLTIDPVLVFSTYTGSFADNWGMTAAYDDLGNLYSGGIVHDDGTYPVSPGAFQVFFGGKASTFGSNSLYWGADMAIVKYNSTGTNRMYATYLGGRNNELPTSIIVNKNGELWIQGITRSNNFPVTATAFDKTFNGVYNQDGSSGDIDIVVAKLNKDCSNLIGSTYIGGSGYDGINQIGNPLHFFYADDSRGEIIIDPADNCYIITSSNSANFPVSAGALKTSLTGSSDAVICKFNFDLSILEWATYFGGNNWDSGYNIERDSQGNIYIVGGTTSNNLPTPINAHRMSYAGGRSDGYIFCLAPDGKSVKHGTYVGTSSYDQTYFVEIDDEGNVYFLGHTLGNYPTKGTAFNLPTGRQFITKMKPDLSDVIFSLRFGSPVARATPEIAYTAFLVDMCQNIYVTGWGGPNFPGQGTTVNLPITPNAIQQTTDGSDFYLMVLEKDAPRLWYATYFGGNRSGDHVDGGTSRFDKYGIVYHSVCASCSNGISLDDFPTTPGVWSRTNNAANCNNGSFKFDFQILDATIAEFKYDTITTRGCTPFIVNFTNQSLGAESYEWDFGDGSPLSNEENPTHTYTLPGIYTVRLVAINNNKCNKSDTTIQFVYVFSPARATFDPQVTGCSFTVTFKNNTVDGTTYTWDFGDGTRSNQYNPPPHTYPRAGTYQVKLTVNSHSFCIDSLVIPVTVTNEPFADYNFQPDPCIPLARFFDRSTGGDTHSWDFGDSATSTEKNPVHTYAQPGTYDVRLIVNPGSSCTDTVIQTVTVEDNQTVAGRLSGGGTICLGDRSPVISLQDHKGSVLRWELSRDGGQNWYNLGKAGFTSYQTGPLTVTTWLRVVIQNGNCSVLTTEPAKIIVQRSPNAGILTADQTFACGEPAFPTLTLTNFNGTVESWEQSTDGEQTWTSINHTASTYQTGAVTRNTAFRVLVRSNTGTCRKGLSSVIRIEVEERTIGGTLSEHTTICLGQRSPTLTLNGHNGTVMKWQLSKNNGQTWVDLGKAGFTTYQPGSLTITTWFRAIIQKGTCAIAPSDLAIITVVREAMPGQITPSQTFCGSKEYLTLTVRGIQAQNYVWEKSENQQDWSVFATNVPIITLTTLNQTTSFRIKATNAFCSERYSQVSTFTVVTAPQAGILSADATICLGQRSPLLTLNNHQGNILGWELSRDSMRTIVNLGKAGFNNYQPGGLTINTWLRVKVGSNFCEPVYSNWVKITVVRNAKGGIITGGGTICLGKPAPTLRLEGNTGRIIRWQTSIDGQNWDNINQTTSFYQPTNLTRTTKYRVEVAGNIGSCGNVFSASAEIQVQNTSFSAGTLSADALTLCPYGNVVLRLTDFTGIISHWEQSNDRINWQTINNNLSEYTDFRLTANRFYRVWVRQPFCGTLQSSNIIPIQIITPTPGVILKASKSVLCSGDNQVIFTLQNYSTGTITWQVSTDGNTFTNLPETTATLTLNRLTSTIVVRAIIQNVCDAQQTSSVTVDVLPALALNKRFTAACSGQSSIELNATGGANTGYTYELIGVGSNSNGRFTGIPTGTYQIKVTDVNGCELRDSISVSYQINPPQIVSFERITERSAWVTWSSDPLDNALVYQVKYRAVGTAEWSIIRNQAVTQLQLTSLEPATEYEVMVEIVCRATPDQPTPVVVTTSSPRTVRTLNNGTCQSEPPSTPTGLQILQVATTQALVSWNPIPDMTINQQGYIISYGQETENPNNYTQQVVCHADTHLWISNLRPNSSYKVRIRSNCTNCITALNITDRRSLWSTTVDFKTLAQRFDVLAIDVAGEILIYPNPNNGRFTVYHPAIIQTGYYSLFDATGRKILQQKLEDQHTETIIESNTLPEGVYLLMITLDGMTYRHKVIRE